MSNRHLSEFNPLFNKCSEVLVTGASGFVATHCVQQLLALGFSVRGSVRSLKNQNKVQPIKELGNIDLLELVEADLERSEDWPRAVEGCDYVLHVASPFPLKEDKAVIQTAVNGTLNVLKACAECNTVQKVVLTSSCAAVNVRNKFALTVINPTFVVGPVLINTQGASIAVNLFISYVQTVKKFLNNEVPAIPPLEMGMVDVRDVAKAHISVTDQPSVSFLQMTKYISNEFRSQGYRTPFITAPYLLVWIWSFVDKEAGASLSRLNRRILFDNSKTYNFAHVELISIRFSPLYRQFCEP